MRARLRKPTESDACTSEATPTWIGMTTACLDRLRESFYVDRVIEANDLSTGEHDYKTENSGEEHQNIQNDTSTINEKLVADNFDLSTKKSSMLQEAQSLKQETSDLKAKLERSEIRIKQQDADLQNSMSAIEDAENRCEMLKKAVNTKDALIEDLREQIQAAHPAADLVHGRSFNTKDRLEKIPKDLESDSIMEDATSPAPGLSNLVTVFASSLKEPPVAAKLAKSGCHYGEKNKENPVQTTAMDFNFGVTSGCEPFTFKAGNASLEKSTLAEAEPEKHQVTKPIELNLESPSAGVLAVQEKPSITINTQNNAAHVNYESPQHMLPSPPNSATTDKETPTPPKSRSERRAADRQAQAEKKKQKAEKNKEEKSNSIKKEKEAKIKALLEASRST